MSKKAKTNANTASTCTGATEARTEPKEEQKGTRGDKKLPVAQEIRRLQHAADLLKQRGQTLPQQSERGQAVIVKSSRLSTTEQRALPVGRATVRLRSSRALLRLDCDIAYLCKDTDGRALATREVMLRGVLLRS